MDDEVDRKNSKLKPKWYAWLIFLLLPLVMYMPILGADLQYVIVGREFYCCSPTDEMKESAAIAQSKRPLSNAIMYGSLFAGVLVLAIFLLLFYRLVWRRLNNRAKIVSGVIVGAVVLALWIWLLHLMIWYGQNTHEYYFQNGWVDWPFFV